MKYLFLLVLFAATLFMFFEILLGNLFSAKLTQKVRCCAMFMVDMVVQNGTQQSVFFAFFTTIMNDVSHLF